MTVRINLPGAALVTLLELVAGCGARSELLSDDALRDGLADDAGNTFDGIATDDGGMTSDDSGADTAFVPDTATSSGSSPCTPGCAGMTCGASDGCSGTCWQGSCPPGETCADGRCMQPATTVVLFGGGDNYSVKSDTWEWDGNAWSERKVPGPGVLAGHSMASLNGKVMLFGGFEPSRGPLNGTWEWDGGTWTQRNVPGPAARSGHAMATLNGKVVLFGGQAADTYAYFGDTWEWDGNTWTLRDVPGPSVRVGHSMATLNGKVVLFGGQGIDHPVTSFYPQIILLGDTWEWDGKAWTERKVPSSPSPRYAPIAALDGKVVLFGGYAHSYPTEQSDTWEWDGNKWTQRDVSGPSARARHTLCALNGKVMLFGGHLGGVGGQSDETWEWDGVGWTQRTNPGPGGRDGHAVAAR